MPKRYPFYIAIVAVVVMGGTVCAAPAIPFAEISTALSKGDGAGAFQLADTALVGTGVGAADHTRLIADRGFARNLQGDKDGALTDLTQAINARNLPNPEQARIFLERGLILDSLNRLNDAEGDYSAVLRLSPSSAAQALNNRANVFRRQNRIPEARRDYLASLASNNSASEYPYFGLGQIAESEGKTDEAKYFYSRAVDANPGYTLAVDRLAALGGAPASSPPAGAPKSTNIAKADPAPRPPQSAFTAAPAAKPAGDATPLRPALDNTGRKPGTGQVQLGAWREEALATAAWKQAVQDAGGALTGLSPHIVPVDLPDKGRFYRLRVEAQDGRQLCAALKAKGLTCIPVRDGAP